jgi:hypothetical protein
MRFEVTNTGLPPRAGNRMMVYVPSDAETERRLQRLVEMKSCS